MPDTYIVRLTDNLTQMYAALKQLVSLGKRQKLNKDINKIDAYRGLIGDVLARYAINKKTGIEMRDIDFGYNDFGKPHILNYPGIYHNISHAGNFVVCAIDDFPIGIDVEEINSFEEGIINRFFSACEKEYVLNALEKTKGYRFYKIWTMKESYIKRDGRGLSLPLTAIDVLNMSNVHFFNVFENDDAICHICTERNVVPSVKNAAISDFLR